MKVYWAECKVKIPPKFGDKPEGPESINFDEEKQRKKILSQFGLDPNSSDEELKATKIELGLSFIKDNMSESKSAYDIIQEELNIARESYVRINKDYEIQHEENLKNYELGYVSDKRVTLSFDEGIRNKQIQAIKDKYELVGEIVVKESLPLLEVKGQREEEALKTVKYKDYLVITTIPNLDYLISDVKSSLGIDISEDIDFLDDDAVDEYDTFISIGDLRSILYGPADSQVLAAELIELKESVDKDEVRLVEFTDVPNEEDLFSKMINL